LSNDDRKSTVFSSRRNVVSDGAFLTDDGRLFHARAEAVSFKLLAKQRDCASSLTTFMAALVLMPLHIPVTSHQRKSLLSLYEAMLNKVSAVSLVSAVSVNSFKNTGN